jgi:hypothetical protein
LGRQEQSEVVLYAVIDNLVTRVDRLEDAVRSAGIHVPKVDQAAIDRWITESAQKRNESTDPRR